jgi:hypothetical protein
MSTVGKAVRWGDNDHYFWRFTWSTESSYSRCAIILKSRGDDDDESGTCYLRISVHKCTLIVALPHLVKPYMEKVRAASWDAATVERLGRDWYWHIEPREYGFSYAEGLLSIYYGRSSMDSSTEQRWGCFLPWTQWRHVRHSFYGLAGEYLFDEPKGRPWGKDPKVWHQRWAEQEARKKTIPVRAFAFKDFDGEALTVTTKIEEREWRFGEGYFKWLSLFRKPKIRRSLDLEFSGETGRRKGSWKGGTLGHSIDMLPGELHERAFRRYCNDHEMTFDGRVDPVAVDPRNFGEQ